VIASEFADISMRLVARRVENERDLDVTFEFLKTRVMGNDHHSNHFLNCARHGIGLNFSP
jgi:hypothetical protein